VRVLVDTHAAVWWLTDDDRLSDSAREAMATADEPLLSAVSLIEVAIKASLRKLPVAEGWADELLAEGFSLLPIGTEHARALRALPFVSVDGIKIRDPFDRLLVAQAGVEEVPIVTRDAAIRAQGAPTIW
jgi:PIN domain nuclease of toxin-antitoxin system